ncbi:hypothetical protein BN2537_15439 [Streptomyces venezuelae]|nr:hypothetical protein BN2537_15439 [Streptomyces venezuelae]
MPLTGLTYCSSNTSLNGAGALCVAVLNLTRPESPDQWPL